MWPNTFDNDCGMAGLVMKPRWGLWEMWVRYPGMIHRNAVEIS